MEIGTKVAYSVQFLKSIGMSHSDMAQARAVITDLQILGKDVTLAKVVWDKNEDLPHKINIKNLAKVGPNRKFCNCD